MWTVVDMLGYCTSTHGLFAFPNMENNENMAIISGKKIL